MLARTPSLRIGTATLAAVFVGAAMATSSIVFSEPALVDALMMGVIVGIPVLGAAKFGANAWYNLALWLGVVAFGLAAAGVATHVDDAVTHQTVTLYLALGAFVLAGYIAADPVPRMRLIAGLYVAGCLVATAAAIAGYFNLLPGAYDLFTNYGRARGTFKDPNVYGAALAPALLIAFWSMLRARAARAWLAAAVALVLAVGLLLSFSRGAWISTAVSFAVLGWIALVSSRRRSDFRRYGLVVSAGTIGVIAALGIASRLEAVESLLQERASLDQSYDIGPEGRFGGQAKAIDLILAHPFGIGTHTFRDTYHPEEPHNVYLSMFLNAGWMGGLLYIVSVVATLLVGSRGALRRGILQGAFLITTAAFSGVVFEGFVIDTDHWRHFFIFIGCIWGLADAAPPVVDGTRRRDDPLPA